MRIIRNVIIGLTLWFVCLKALGERAGAAENVVVTLLIICGFFTAKMLRKHRLSQKSTH